MVLWYVFNFLIFSKRNVLVVVLFFFNSHLYFIFCLFMHYCVLFCYYQKQIIFNVFHLIGVCCCLLCRVFPFFDVGSFLVLESESVCLLQWPVKEQRIFRDEVNDKFLCIYIFQELKAHTFAGGSKIFKFQNLSFLILFRLL